MVDVAWNTSSSGTWTVSGPDIYKDAPSSSWTSFNSGQSTTATFRFYDIEPNAPGSAPSWIGATTVLSASTSYSPGASEIKYGFQFPNGSAGTKFRTIEDGVATERDTWIAGDKFEIDATSSPPVFKKNGVAIVTSGTALSGALLFMSCNIQNTGSSLHFDGCQYESGSAPSSSTLLFPPPVAYI